MGGSNDSLLSCFQAFYKLNAGEEIIVINIDSRFNM